MVVAGKNRLMDDTIWGLDGTGGVKNRKVDACSFGGCFHRPFLFPGGKCGVSNIQKKKKRELHSS